MAFLDPIIEKLLSNPVYIITAALIAVFLAIGIIKKMIKLLAVLTVGFVIFLGFLHITGREFPADAGSLKKAVNEVINQTQNHVQF